MTLFEAKGLYGTGLRLEYCNEINSHVLKHMGLAGCEGAESVMIGGWMFHCHCNYKEEYGAQDTLRSCFFTGGSALGVIMRSFLTAFY